MSDIIETAKRRGTLADSDAFLSELRKKPEEPDQKARMSFWTKVSRGIENDRQTDASFRSTANKLARRKFWKFALRVLIVNAVLFGVLYIVIFHSRVRYHKAETLMEAGNYAEAQEIFLALGEKDYKDSKQRAADCQNNMDNGQYLLAEQKFENGEFADAMGIFEQIPGYKDSKAYIQHCREGLVSELKPVYTWDFSKSLNSENGITAEQTGEESAVTLSRTANLAAEKAAYFPGGEAGLCTLAQIDLSRDWTLTMLVRCENIHADESCLAAYSMNGAGYHHQVRLMLENGCLVCRVNDGVQEELSVKAMQPAEMHKWTLVTVVKRGNFLGLYLDRLKRMESQDSSDYTPQEGVDSELTETLWFGYDPANPENGSFVGDMSRIWIFSSALTEEQIGFIAAAYLDSAETEERTADIPTNAVASNGHHYAAFSNCITVQEAIDYCAKRGGYLASVGSESENEMLHTAFARPLVIGYTTVNGGASWQWVNGESVSYQAIAEDCDPPLEEERYYARFSKVQENPSWYLYHDTSMKTDDDGNTPEQEPFVFLCEWDS